MALKRGDPKLMQELKTNGDLGAVAAALNAGEITDRQAKNAVKFIETARDIRENPIRTALIESEGGGYAGEVSSLPGGKWLARCYGPDYDKNPGVTVDSFELAEKFVRDEDV